MSKETKHSIPVVPKGVWFPFILLTSCFAWWGLANNMTDTLLPFFKRLMSMSDFQTSWIQMAFYGAYFCLAIPAALIVQRFSYKVGVLFGLGMFAVGGLLFYPSSLFFGYESTSDTMKYVYFLISLYIFAGGCSILETSANPYILAMGDPETATRRLNLAQSFNPIGSILGVMILSKFLILSNLTPFDPNDRAILDVIDSKSLDTLQLGELHGAITAYVGFALLLVVVWVAILLCKMPACSANKPDKGIAKNIWNFVSIPMDALHFNKGSFFYQMREVLSHRNYLWGVIAQFFYVGAQICVWSYTIRYAMQELHILEASASDIYIAGMFAFVGMRFVCTWLMKYISPNMLLATMSVLAVLCCLPVMFIGGKTGVVSLICISGCMSLMFPTIYGIASEGLGEKMKIGGCGLIMAILGGAVITAVQGRVSDAMGINFSYIVPAFCFIVVAYYGFMTEKGAEYDPETGKTSMPHIPGKLLAFLCVMILLVGGACMASSKSAAASETAVAGADVQKTGIAGCYALEEPAGTFDVIEIVPTKDKVKEGEFKGIVRHYVLSKLDASGKIKARNVDYRDVGTCFSNTQGTSVCWQIGKNEEAFSYDPAANSVTFGSRKYAPAAFAPDHEALTAEILLLKEVQTEKE